MFRRWGRTAPTVAANLLRHDQFLLFSFHEDAPVVVRSDDLRVADYCQAIYRLFEYAEVELTKVQRERIELKLAERRALRYEAREADPIAEFGR